MYKTFVFLALWAVLLPDITHVGILTAQPAHDHPEGTRKGHHHHHHEQHHGSLAPGPVQATLVTGQGDFVFSRDEYPSRMATCRSR